MLVDPAALLRALGLPEGTVVDAEPLGDALDAPERVALRPPAGGEQVVLVRRSLDPDEAANHIAVMEALTAAAFPFAPRLLAVLGDAAVEEWVEAATALALLPPTGAAEAAIQALAALHTLPTREGLDWERTPAELLADEEAPLHRLGFAAQERDLAVPLLAEARSLLLRTPFGFAHRDATAAHVLLLRGEAKLINFSRAGFGPQLFDVAAFLLTSGIEPSGRRVLAAMYAASAGTDGEATVDFIDLAGILWGIQEQLGLPRRLIEALGDDLASEALRTAAARIDRGLRAGAGDHPAAAAIRNALWRA
jgi:aminoglycoside phosphotransferase (APT) family kinase protein